MKTILSSLALLFALSLPASIAAQTLGLSVPGAFGIAPILSAFVATWSLLTALGDYGRSRDWLASANASVAPTAKSVHALAA